MKQRTDNVKVPTNLGGNDTEQSSGCFSGLNKYIKPLQMHVLNCRNQIYANVLLN